MYSLREHEALRWYREDYAFFSSQKHKFSRSVNQEYYVQLNVPKSKWVTLFKIGCTFYGWFLWWIRVKFIYSSTGVTHRIHNLYYLSISRTSFFLVNKFFNIFQLPPNKDQAPKDGKTRWSTHGGASTYSLLCSWPCHSQMSRTYISAPSQHLSWQRERIFAQPFSTKHDLFREPVLLNADLLQQLLADYDKEMTKSFPFDITPADLGHISRFLPALHDVSLVFFRQTLSCHPMTGEETNLSLPTRSELCRIQRSIIRIEIFSILFYGVEDHPSYRPSWNTPREELGRLFFSGFEVWEIMCIRDFFYRQYDIIFKDCLFSWAPRALPLAGISGQKFQW